MLTTFLILTHDLFVYDWCSDRNTIAGMMSGYVTVLLFVACRYYKCKDNRSICLAHVYTRPPVSLRHYHYLSSYIGFQLPIELHLIGYCYIPYSFYPTIDIRNLLHFSDIFRTFKSSVSKQFFFPKTQLNSGKSAFSVIAPTIRNQFPNLLKLQTPFVKIKNKIKRFCLKLFFLP